MPKSPKRKEFESIKKKKGFYNQFGGKDKSKDIHHKIPLDHGGTNDDENLCQIDTWWHQKIIHKLFFGGLLRIHGKNPSIKSLADDIADADISFTQQKMAMEDVKNHYKSLER